MSYTTSRESVHRVEHILKDLLNATDDCVFVSPEPHKLAYQLHEALSNVAAYAEFTQYINIKSKYRVRVRQGKVVAELRGKEVVALKVVQEQLAKMRVADVTNVIGIVGACHIHKQATELYFPDAKLSALELATLYNWSDPAGFFIIHNGDAGVTLTRVASELAWSPNGSR